MSALLEPSQEPTEGGEFYDHHLIGAETKMVLAVSSGWMDRRQGSWGAGVLGAGRENWSLEKPGCFSVALCSSQALLSPHVGVPNPPSTLAIFDLFLKPSDRKLRTHFGGHLTDV